METQTLLKDGKFSTVAQPLACGAFFGKEVLAQCTPGRTPELRGLPREEFKNRDVQAPSNVPFLSTAI